MKYIMTTKTAIAKNAITIFFQFTIYFII
jgi:hypothetical protein